MYIIGLLTRINDCNELCRLDACRSRKSGCIPFAFTCSLPGTHSSFPGLCTCSQIAPWPPVDLDKLANAGAVWVYLYADGSNLEGQPTARRIKAMVSAWGSTISTFKPGRRSCRSRVNLFGLSMAKPLTLFSQMLRLVTCSATNVAGSFHSDARPVVHEGDQQVRTDYIHIIALYHVNIRVYIYLYVHILCLSVGWTNSIILLLKRKLQKGTVKSGKGGIHKGFLMPLRTAADCFFVHI